MPAGASIIITLALVFYTIVVWAIWLVPYLSPLVYAMVERAK